jgi:hypothetical protein
MRTNPLKSIAKGFFAMTAATSTFSIIALFRSGDAWLGLLYFLILLIPLSGAAYFWRGRQNRISTTADSYGKWSHILFALLGVALACWAYDLATTFYAIDVARVAFEINPLGWPLGALGALAYYAPTVTLTYVLLFKIRQKMSLYAAVPITLVALCMGVMNLNAGVGNFSFFLSTASISAGIRYNLLALIAVVDLAYAALMAKVSRSNVLQKKTKNLNPWRKN